ncbi:hypothetical protein GAPWK_0743 [Gilliamella apicola]|nr:hypothetical protein GAPWK_0743 [Gilliamella apicola]
MIDNYSCYSPFCICSFLIKPKNQQAGQPRNKKIAQRIKNSLVAIEG